MRLDSLLGGAIFAGSVLLCAGAYRAAIVAFGLALIAGSYLRWSSSR